MSYSVKTEDAAASESPCLVGAEAGLLLQAWGPGTLGGVDRWESLGSATLHEHFSVHSLFDVKMQVNNTQQKW